nr:ribonuclease H-like domain-containing protein [Tanacetum cinerariifolium]
MEAALNTRYGYIHNLSVAALPSYRARHGYNHCPNQVTRDAGHGCNHTPGYHAVTAKYQAFSLPVIEFPLPEEVPTASEECSHCQKKREATAVKIALLLKSRRNCQSKSNDSYAKKNDVKERNTLLLSLPDEYQLRFSKYKTAQELWAVILKTFSDNEATKKTKKNLIKQQYGNFKAEGLETLEQTFNKLQVIFNQLSDLDTMSLDDLYNHLKVYESEVQKKLKTNSQNMAFISSAKHSRGNEEVNTASTNVPTASANIGVIDEDDIEEMDIKWNMALLSMRADSYMANDEENHALVADEEAPTEFVLMAKTSAESEVFNNSLCSKDCLAQVKARLAEHRDRELKYCEKIRVLEFKTESSADCIETSKDLDSLLESQRLDKNKEGLGYSVVPPPPAQIYSPPKKDMSWTGLPEFKDDIVTNYSRPLPVIESTSDDAQNRNPSEASPSTISPKPFIKFVKANDSLTKSKTDKAEKAKKPPVRYAEQYRKPTKKPNVRGNQRNWNNLKSHQLGPNFVINKKACFNCGDFNHLAYDCRKRVKKETSRSQNNTYKSFTPRPTVHKPHRPPMRPMRSNMNATQPNKTSFNKQTHSYTKRPFQRTSAVRSQYRGPRVPHVSRKFSTINKKFPTANRKFPTCGIKFSTADIGKKGKAGSSQNNIDDKGYWDSGCSRHITGNISYLYDYEPFDRGYVSFGQGGCKIIGKGTIKIECIVLGQNFKLSDDDNVLLRTPRQHNMYSIDLNNIVPHKDLTCLVAKASADECMLWHRRLGHLNFKTMNRLFRHNLVRGLHSKWFENDHTCTACLKGKQHKASCFFCVSYEMRESVGVENVVCLRRVW